MADVLVIKKWNCYGHVVASKYLGTVEARTKEEAIEKAWQLDSASVSICHECAHEVEDPEINDITVEEE